MCTAMLLGGCTTGSGGSANETSFGQKPETGTGENSVVTSSPAPPSAQNNSVPVINASDMFTDRDSRTGYDETTAIYITLTETSASCASSAVSVDGSTITIRGEGTYVISGTLDNGMVIVDADKSAKVQVVLAGAHIQNSASAALYIKKADKVFLTLAEGTKNEISNGGRYVAIDDNNIDAAIFSKDDLTINGSGSLLVTAAAGHGIVSKNDLAVTGGSLYITAEGHGMAGKDSIRIKNGSFEITSGKDGLHADNSEDASSGFLYIANGCFTVTAEGDGMDASSDLMVADGSFTITAGGGIDHAKAHAQEGFGGRGWAFPGSVEEDTKETSTSTKGLKASGNLSILGGTFTVNSADDGFHANGSLSIAGGTFTVASGDDGFHADDALTVLSGTIDITDSYEGIEGKTIEISGGSIRLAASDDGLNAAGGNDSNGSGGGRGRDSFAAQEGVYILISGGDLHIDAGGDGIDSNGDLTVTGGTIYVDGPTNDGDGALDKNGTALIHGGTLVAVGAAGMAETFDSASTQGCILVNAASTQAAGTKVELFDASGSLIVSYTAAKPFRSVVVSAPSVTLGSTYRLVIGTEVSEITMTTISYGLREGNSGGFGGKNRPGRGDRPESENPDTNPPMKPDRSTTDGNMPAPPDMDIPGGNMPAPPDTGAPDASVTLPQDTGTPDGKMSAWSITDWLIAECLTTGAADGHITSGS